MQQTLAPVGTWCDREAPRLKRDRWAFDEGGSKWQPILGYVTNTLDLEVVHTLDLEEVCTRGQEEVRTPDLAEECTLVLGEECTRGRAAACTLV